MRPRSPGTSTCAGGPLAALVLVLACAPAPAGCWDELPQTTSGSLRGEAVSLRGGRRVLRYLGVRYASAPRRFAAPEPFSLDDTARVVDALEWPPACPQPHNLTEVAYPQFAPRRAPDAESEDCLFLNVFAPAPAAEAEAEDEEERPKQRAVLVWLPGEGLGMADASRYDATLLADTADIVVVTLNYRVGVLGFLSTGSAAAAGNWGLLDVVEALHWVRRNAPAVGADPARVTLAGRAEGASLASLLLAAQPGEPPPPLARRFILQSGVASAWYSIDADPANATSTLANILGCTGTASQAVSCLRLVPVGLLMTVAQSLGRRWRPVLDGQLISTEPLRSVRRWAGAGAGAALMVGEAAGEGALCLLRHFLLERRLWPAVAADNLTRRDFTDLVAEHLLDFANIRDQSVVDAAVHEYRPWGQSGGSGFREAALRFCGLLYGRGRAEQLSRALAKRGATVWRFEMGVRPACSPHPAFMGAVPGDELPALFPTLDGSDGSGCDESAVERRLAIEMLHMWANFIKTGNPNLDEEENSTTTQIWPQFVDSSRQMYVFTLNGSRKKSTEFLSRDADFWGTVVPSLLRMSLKKGCSCGRKKNLPRMNTCTTTRCPALSVLIAFNVVLGIALVMISYFFLQHIRKSKGLLANEHLPQS